MKIPFASARLGTFSKYFLECNPTIDPYIKSIVILPKFNIMANLRIILHPSSLSYIFYYYYNPPYNTCGYLHKYCISHRNFLYLQHSKSNWLKTLEMNDSLYIIGFYRSFSYSQILIFLRWQIKYHN